MSNNQKLPPAYRLQLKQSVLAVRYALSIIGREYDKRMTATKKS